MLELFMMMLSLLWERSRGGRSGEIFLMSLLWYFYQIYFKALMLSDVK